MTVSCTDTDGLPRVSNAGDVDLVDGTAVQVMHNGILVEKDSYCGAWMTEIIRCLRRLPRTTRRTGLRQDSRPASELRGLSFHDRTRLLVVVLQPLVS